MQRQTITSTIKRLPERMFGIGVKIGHFEQHPVWNIGAVSADLYADPSPGCVKGRADDCARLVKVLPVVAIEDRRQIRADGAGGEGGGDPHGSARRFRRSL